MLTRLNGVPFALNPDLIERAEATPDTVITLVDGKHYIVEEPLDVIIERVAHARAVVLAEVAAVQAGTPLGSSILPAADTLQAVPALHEPAAPHEAGDVIPMRRNP